MKKPDFVVRLSKQLKGNRFKNSSAFKAQDLRDLLDGFEKATKLNAELDNALNNVDFWLDEWGCGYARRPRTGKATDVPKAVKAAITHFHVRLAVMDRFRMNLRSALTQVKVDHINKKINLSIETHSDVENVLHSTLSTERAVKDAHRRGRAFAKQQRERLAAKRHPQD